MEASENNPILPVLQVSPEDQNNPCGYPVYAANEDVFRKFWEENDFSNEDLFSKRRKRRSLS